MEFEDVTIDNLVRGAVIEELNAAIERCVADMGDPNATPESVREVNLKIQFKPNAGLTAAAVKVQVSTKLAQPCATTGDLFLVHTRTGLRAVADTQLGLSFGSPSEPLPSKPVPVESVVADVVGESERYG